MSDTTPISLPIDADLAPLLSGPGSDQLRLQIGRLASRMLRARTDTAELIETIGRLKVHAHMRGLTDDLLAEELALAAGEGIEP